MRPQPRQGRSGVARAMRFTLSGDHRAVDCAVAAQWMQEFIGLLENPCGS
ncbi:2-oxo acid dehydrogenase subunit E2 [Streptomyces sp. NPDC005708]